MRLLLFLLSVTAVIQAAIPTPETWFGHPIGADRHLLDWDKVTGYFERLQQSSDRIRVTEFGRSAEGRPLIVAVISQPDTLRHLDRYREIQRRLADPRLTSPAEAEDLVQSGKTVVLITCSIHATEVASTHTAVQFAYRALTGAVPHLDQILENTIVLLVPSINPDGVDLVTRWYRQTLGTPFEGTAPPELYQKYTGHDNNRDWYIFSQPETRAVVASLQNVWHPQIVYDVHQMGARGARLFLPPWLDPIEPNVDATLAQEMNTFGAAMAADLTADGLDGITINSTYDFWSPSRAYQAFHGGLRILSESASAKLATPVTIPFEELDRSELGYDAQVSSWNFLQPWRGGKWTLRDIIRYQQAAFDSCLYQAALHRESLLRNFYGISQRAVQRTDPRGFLVAAEQRDAGATRRLLETLSFGQVEIRRAGDGSYFIPMDQPYSSYAKALLERQDYPDIRLYSGGPPRRPYDVTAHTLPLLFGVDAHPVHELPPGALPLQRFSLFSDPPRSLRAQDTDAWTTINALWNSGEAVWRDWKTGDFSQTQLNTGWKLLKRPRIALYRSWIPAIDEGWTRWLLERFGFPYTRVTNEDFRGANLRSRFDTILFPDQPSSDLEKGFVEGSMPPQYTGGIGAQGIKSLGEFARKGGTLIFLNRSTDFAIRQFRIPAHNGIEHLSPAEFYSPGSLLNVHLASGNPLTLGLPENITIWSEQSPAWEVTAHSVAQYPESSILASGWLLGASALSKRSALLDIPEGEGHVVLFGMRPQYRAQSYQTFKLLFNALLLSSNHPARDIE